MPPFALEIGFIIFICCSYMYFLYGEQIHAFGFTAYRFATAALTVSATATGAYYLWANPDKRWSLLETMVSQAEKKKEVKK